MTGDFSEVVHMMTALGLEKADLETNPSYTALNMPYPTGKIIAAQKVQAVYWL